MRETGRQTDHETSDARKHHRPREVSTEVSSAKRPQPEKQCLDYRNQCRKRGCQHNYFSPRNASQVDPLTREQSF